MGAYPKALALVNVLHFTDQIIDDVQQIKGWGSNVLISDERNKVLETDGVLLRERPLLQDDEPYITINIVILTNLNLFHLLDYHKEHQPLISFGVTNRKTSRNFLFDENDRLCGWRNNATGETKGPFLTFPEAEGMNKQLIEKAYSCVVVFEQHFFDLCKQSGKFSLTEPYLDLAKDHLILGYDHSGDKLVDVGKPESVKVAESMFE
jgi:N-acetyl-alpha-D-muramate 1-phosphate uridylyltransferase